MTLADELVADLLDDDLENEEEAAGEKDVQPLTTPTIGIISMASAGHKEELMGVIEAVEAKNVLEVARLIKAPRLLDLLKVLTVGWD